LISTNRADCKFGSRRRRRASYTRHRYPKHKVLNLSVIPVTSSIFDLNVCNVCYHIGIEIVGPLLLVLPLKCILEFRRQVQR
jgi:hypothetical protein